MYINFSPDRDTPDFSLTILDVLEYTTSRIHVTNLQELRQLTEPANARLSSLSSRSQYGRGPLSSEWASCL